MTREEAIKEIRGWGFLNEKEREAVETLIPELKESEDEKVRKELIKVFSNREKYLIDQSFGDITVSEVLAWLKKQDEQKASVVDFKAEDWYVSKVDGKIHNIYHSVDKVQPKFYEGEWVVQGDNILKIKCVGDTYYCFETVGGYVDDMLVSEIDSQFHLWTIKDARDGDILSNGNMIVIFKQFEEPSYRQHIIAYIGLDNFGCIQVTDEHWELGIDKVKLATKKQCDLLFQKMKEFGYKWNGETKELKKIEQKPAECRQETKPNGGIVCEDFNEGDGFYKVNLAYLSKSQVELVENLVTSWQNPTNNTVEWSEEDEDDLNNIIWLCDNCIRKCEHTWVPSQATRIKSLIERIKDIVFLQPKQQWSEEDEKK